MSRKARIFGAITRRRIGDSRVLPVLLTSCLLAVVLVGCQREASTAKTPAIPSESPAAAVAQTPATVLPEPAPKTEEAGSAETTVDGLLPKIAIEKPVLDLGEIGTDTKQTGKFEFKSAGTAVLRILRVHACCGVTIRGLEGGEEFAPGESGSLEFDYFTGSTPVEEEKRELRLQTNDPNQNIVTMTIKAKVVRRVVLEPDRLRLFLRQENAGCGAIVIRSLDGKPFSVTDFKSTANAISAEIDPNVKATEFTLKPRADLETLKRNVRGMVSISLDHPECTNVRLSFDVLPEFTVNPGHLMEINLRPEQPIQRVIWVLSNYVEDFDIESVSSQKGLVKLMDKEKVEGRYRLQVRIDPPAREDGDVLVADMIEVKIKDSETVSIPFRGFYAGQ